MPSAALTDDEVLLVRLSAQRLLQSAPVRPRDVVRAVVGVQAQDQTAAALQLRARSAGLTLAEVARARNEERTVVRTWAIRGTLHWLAVEDVRWLLELLGEDAIRRNRRRREQLGLDDQTCIEAVRLLREDLAARGPLTRDEIVSELADRGVRLEGQARPHLLYVAAFQGVICGGPDRGSQETYVLIDDWVPRSKALPR